MNSLHRWYCRSGIWKKFLEQKVLPWALAGVDLGPDVLEVGPGPGLTTDVLRLRFSHLTSLEIDTRLAHSLGNRMKDSNVEVVEGDATNMPFERESFSGAVAFTMLHHVPSAGLQDRLLSEVLRVLKPGGIFVGTDSVLSLRFRLFHIRDTMVPVNPATFGARLQSAGFRDLSIDATHRSFRFRARRPLHV